jgi:hypothetical protein
VSNGDLWCGIEWEGAAFTLIMEVAEMESPSSLEEEKLPCILMMLTSA